MTDTLVVRVNATAELGVGHFMRGLALAQAWSDRRGEVVFVANDDLLPAVARRAASEGFRVMNVSCRAGIEDGNATRDIARAVGARYVVADGYGFGVDFQRAVREGAPLLVVDDNGENGAYVADLVLNQNLHAADGLYRSRASTTRLLLGPSYVLLRRELASAAPRGAALATPHEVGRVVVTMGGSDPRGLTGIAVDAVRRAFAHAEIVAVVGASVPLGVVDATVLRDVPDMGAVLASADLAVSAAGSTAWELALLGTPMVLVVCADNQRAHARGLVERGVAIDGGAWDTLDVVRLAEAIAEARSPEARARLGAAGRALVDGRGAQRVVDVLWPRAESSDAEAARDAPP